MLSDSFISIVIPLDNQTTILPDFIQQVSGVLAQNYANYEIILIDDGSRDNAQQVVGELMKDAACIRYIRLSRRFGREIAITAGLDTAIGDYVILMDVESSPPELLTTMVALGRAGNDIVYGVTTAPARQPIWRRIGRRLFYAYCRRILLSNIPENVTDYLLLSRKAVNAITVMRDQYRYTRLFSGIIGFNTQTLSYQPVNHSGRQPIYHLGQEINFAIDVIVANSNHPLRLAGLLGVAASLFNLAYIGYILVVNLVKRTVEGWTTTSTQNAVMFLLISIILTVMSEYIGRTLVEARERPLYFVVEEKESSIAIADENRRNVVDDPLQAVVS